MKLEGRKAFVTGGGRGIGAGCSLALAAAGADVAVAYRRGAEAPRSDWGSRSVGDYALPLEKIPVLTQDEDLASGLAKLVQDDVGRGLVLQEGRLVGLLSITDLMRIVEDRGPRGDAGWLRERTSEEG